MDLRGSYHDHFAGWVIRDLGVIKDILRHYLDKQIADIIDPDRLQPFETTLITRRLKKVVLDQAFVSQFRDDVANTELFVAVEHKSSPNRFVVLQLGAQVFNSLYSMWTKVGRPDAKSFKLPVPIMIVLYHGKEDWNTDDLHFQGIFDHIPEEIRENVPQFRVIAINLSRFEYGKLPGSPETQALIEAMKRAMDGTLAKNLKKIVRSLERLPMDQRIRDIAQSIIIYAAWSTDASKEQLEEAILTVWKGDEGNTMTETIQKGFRYECEVQYTKEGKVEGKIEGVLVILKERFKRVPKEIKKSLATMNDPIALDSLLVHAATCTSLEDFADSL